MAFYRLYEIESNIQEEALQEDVEIVIIYSAISQVDILSIEYIIDVYSEIEYDELFSEFSEFISDAPTGNIWQWESGITVQWESGVNVELE